MKLETREIMFHALIVTESSWPFIWECENYFSHSLSEILPILSEKKENMNQKENYKTLPIFESHNCFACGHMNHSGLQMEFFTDETSVFSKLKLPSRFCGWNNLVHGGIVTTILDETMGWSAIYLLKKVVLTRSITIDYLKPVFVDTELKAEGKVLKVVSEREAIIEGIIYNEEGDVCTRSEGTFSLLTPEAGIKLKVVDENALKDLQPLLQTSYPEC